MVTDRIGPKGGWTDVIRHADPRMMLRRPKDDFRRLVLVNTVIAAVLLLVVGGLAALLYQAPRFGAFEGDSHPDTLTHVLVEPVSTIATRMNDEYRFELVWNVTMILPHGDMPLWNGSKVTIFDEYSESNILPSAPYMPLVPWPITTSGNPTAFYIERIGNADGPDVGDALGVTGLTRQY